MNWLVELAALLELLALPLLLGLPGGTPRAMLFHPAGNSPAICEPGTSAFAAWIAGIAAALARVRQAARARRE